jgi:hypothetical protein
MINKFLFYNFIFLHLLLLSSNAYSQEKKNFTLAIINLDAKGVSVVEGELLSEKLRTNISQFVETSEFKKKSKVEYTIVEQAQIDKVLEQFNVQNLGCVSDSCAVEFGKMLQVDRIVIGTVGKIGKIYTIAVRIVDVESRKSIATASRDTKGSIDDVHGKIIPLLVKDLLIGKKTSYKKWYIIGTVAVIIGSGVAVYLNNKPSDKGTINIHIPEPAKK